MYPVILLYLLLTFEKKKNSMNSMKQESKIEKEKNSSPDLDCEGDVNIRLRPGGVDDRTPFSGHTQHRPFA